MHKPEWISVNDRLPENLQDVLAYVDGIFKVVYITYKYNVDGQWSENYSFTHWTELPEQPDDKI